MFIIFICSATTGSRFHKSESITPIVRVRVTGFGPPPIPNRCGIAPIFCNPSWTSFGINSLLDDLFPVLLLPLALLINSAGRFDHKESSLCFCSIPLIILPKPAISSSLVMKNSPLIFLALRVEFTLKAFLISSCTFPGIPKIDCLDVLELSFLIALPPLCPPANRNGLSRAL